VKISLPSIAALAIVFAVTRLPALQLHAVETDVKLYGKYAAEWQTAARQGESFYDLHRQRVQEQMEQSTPTFAAALVEYQTVEYPPLAITFMNLPAWLIDADFMNDSDGGQQANYQRAYTLLMAVLDVVVLVLVIFLVHRLYPTATRFEQLQRCLAYVICSWPLYAVLYTRLDLGVAVLVLGAMALLVSRFHWAWSFAVLAAAVHFKLMPIVLAPLWIIASLPITALSNSRYAVRDLAARTAVFAGFGLAMLVPYYLHAGPAVLSFLGYHRDRGLEIESTWTTFMLPAKFLGYSWEVYHSHGSVNVRTPLSAFLASSTTVVLSGLLAAGTSMFVVTAWRNARLEREALLSEALTIAQRWPRLVAGFTLLLLLVSIVVNKVFSPQYLLWILPMVPLIDFGGPGRRLFFASMFVVCFLTMRIFPDCFVGEIVWVAGTAYGFPLFDGPTVYGACLLLARNGICVILLFLLANKLLTRIGMREQGSEFVSVRPRQRSFLAVPPVR
jgi:hypothetical protein